MAWCRGAHKTVCFSFLFGGAEPSGGGRRASTDREIKSTRPATQSRSSTHDLRFPFLVTGPVKCHAETRREAVRVHTQPFSRNVTARRTRRTRYLHVARCGWGAARVPKRSARRSVAKRPCALRPYRIIAMFWLRLQLRNPTVGFLENSYQ